MYNVDILEHLMAASAGKDKRLRQALEMRMGTLGGDPPCSIVGVMREILS